MSKRHAKILIVLECDYDRRSEMTSASTSQLCYVPFITSFLQSIFLFISLSSISLEKFYLSSSIIEHLTKMLNQKQLPLWPPEAYSLIGKRDPNEIMSQIPLGLQISIYQKIFLLQQLFLKGKLILSRGKLTD